jgi:hypothetical protein
MLLDSRIWAKFRFNYYARLESMMINFGWNWIYIKMNLDIITSVIVHNYLRDAL